MTDVQIGEQQAACVARLLARRLDALARVIESEEKARTAWAYKAVRNAILDALGDVPHDRQDDGESDWPEKWV